MADVANKYPQNVGGQFYVDDQCIDCDLCRETAPANFTRNDDGGHSFVYKQQRARTKKLFAKKRWRDVPLKPSEAMVTDSKPSGNGRRFGDPIWTVRVDDRTV